MNCREFEARWNELLDARPATSSELERALESHASVCEQCRGVSAGYQVLRQAVAAWPPPPSPSLESLERLYALTVPPTSPTSSRKPSRSRYWASLASAAAVFALAWLGEIGEPIGTPPKGPEPATKPSVVATRPLGEAIAEAKEATIDLARAASAPASRIGRDVLDLQGLSSSGLPSKLDWDETPIVPTPSAPGVLQAVGERVTASVRPISGSARHAFGFLLGPPETNPAPLEAEGSF